MVWFKQYVLWSRSYVHFKTVSELWARRENVARGSDKGIIWHTMELNKASRILVPLILFATASAATTGESGVEEGNLGYFLITVLR